MLWIRLVNRTKAGPAPMSSLPRLYADLHLHPTLFSFNRMRNHPDEHDPEKFHPWRVLPQDLRQMDEGVRAASYAQCNPPKLAAGRLRLAFASITPIEKGFFVGSGVGDDAPFLFEALRMVSGATAAESLLRLVKSDHQGALESLARILRNKGPLRQALQRIFLKYGMKRIRYLLSDDYDYWDEFLREYDFLRAADGITHRATLDRLDGDEVVETRIEGTYHLVKTGAQLESIIEGGEDIALVLTIEGAHTFSVGPDHRPLAPEVVFERIDELRALPHPILFVTLAHHFDNGICGHAHSLPDAGQLVMDQRPRMHQGFERSGGYGMQVVRELLDLDDDLTDRGGRRILIDVKHMSPLARKELYEEVINPYNQRHASRRTAGEADGTQGPALPKIPVIASHAAYAGVHTLDGFIDNAERENDHWHIGSYYAWGINLSDQDVRMIHASEGLVGICFDQRICGVKPRERVPREHAIHVLAHQIFGLADVILRDDRLSDDEKIGIWDRICIGSDYDGLIDPVTAYPTCLHLDDLAVDLRELLWQNRHTRLIDRVGVDALVEKFAWKNAYDFAKRHLF